MDPSLEGQSSPRKGIIRLAQPKDKSEAAPAWPPIFVPQAHLAQQPDRRHAVQGEDGVVADRAMSREGLIPHTGSERYTESSKSKYMRESQPVSAHSSVHAAGSDPKEERQNTRRHGKVEETRRHGRGGSRHGGGGRDKDGIRSSNRTDADGRSLAGRLFDPRRDDPVRFAALRKGSGNAGSTEGATGSASLTSMSDARSILSSNAPSATTMSTMSSEGRERRRRRGPGSRTTFESGENDSSKHKGRSRMGDAAADHNSYVIELKRRYRDLSMLERKLQAEHKTASEQHRRMQAEMSTQAIAGPSAPATYSISDMLPEGHGINKNGNLDHAYWIDLISQHRTLAEAHVAFMEAALRPGLPASLQSLSQTYNIPTRLWHTGFHSLLERFRTLLPTWQTLIAMHETGVSTGLRAQIAEVLDLMTEFIYFAYAYYSNLLESELFKVFRSSWIENLGDIARYRMAVAKINYLVGINDGVKGEAQRRGSGSARTLATEKDNGKSRRHIDEDEHQAESDDEVEKSSAQLKQDDASIGVAAAQDWDLEEKEVWRATARGWYAKGLAEVPGTGRLHHHLGILSRDDELRALYHFCKSLTTSHPYPAARESILPLFDRSVQTRRISEDATLIDLFVHMHGILFTKVQLDDLEPILERFSRQLKNGQRNLRDALPASASMMMATINVAAILGYGSTVSARGDGSESHGLLRPLTSLKQKGGAHTTERDTEEDEVEEEEDDVENEEIYGHAADEANAEEAGPLTQTRDDTFSASSYKALRLTFELLEAVIGIQLEPEMRSRPTDPYITILLTFISQECKVDGMLPRFEAYVPWDRLIALGNSVPAYIEPIDPRHDVPHKIRSNDVPLPEDWCLRGMAWVGRRVYERGFWKAHKSDRQVLRGGLAIFESEMDMIERFSHTGDQAGLDADGEEVAEDDEAEDDDAYHTHAPIRSEGTTVLTLRELRWKRLVYALTVLIKSVPGLDFDINPGNVHARHGVLVIAQPLKGKIIAWQAEATRQEVERAIGHVKLAALEGIGDTIPNEAKSMRDIDGEYDLDQEDEEEGFVFGPMPTEDGGSEETRTLMRRRWELHEQLRQAKIMDLPRPLGRAGHDHRSDKHRHSRKEIAVRMLPGYTTLVLDTNVFLTPTDIFMQLSEPGNWMVVVPLAVVTELDGLKRRADDVGRRAEIALKNLESRMKTKQVRVQTSRGNFLSDLKVRQENIHFAAVGSGAGWPATYGRDGETTSRAIVASSAASKHAAGGKALDVENDESGATQARSVDDVILRCLHWQSTTHWRNRLILFCSDDKELARREAEVADTSESKPAVARAALVTLDRNLRIKARFRQLHALGPQDLIDLLLRDATSVKST